MKIWKFKAGMKEEELNEAVFVIQMMLASY